MMAGSSKVDRHANMACQSAKFSRFLGPFPSFPTP